MAREQVEAMLGQMRQLAKSEGVDMNFDRVRHTNTHRAHRVLHLAKQQGVQAEMQERLFRAYFSEGAEIADPEQLAALGEEVGLAHQEVIDAFHDESVGADVERDITRAQMLGVNAVPIFCSMKSMRFLAHSRLTFLQTRSNACCSFSAIAPDRRKQHE